MSPADSAVVPCFLIAIADPPLTARVDAPVLAFVALKTTMLPAVREGEGDRETAQALAATVSAA
jgi:hypothetical protein